MSRKGAERGRVPYTARALKQDAQEALGNDLIRGLIELVTNSDDSYATIGSKGVGKIWIGVDHSYSGQTHEVVVRDRAAGMTRKEMHDKLLPIGGRASGSEAGEAVRGNRGRGAKDLVAFGAVLFESIKDGRYSYLRLFQSGDYELDDRESTADDRERLGIPRGSGTQVTVDCIESVRRPRHERLRDTLSRDFQLRDIVSDPKRDIILAATNTGKADRLRDSVGLSTQEQLIDTTVEVDGYPAAGRIPLKVYKLAERSDAGPSDPTRTGGILIVGRRAIYDNTLFKYEGIPYAGWLTGRLQCPYIDQLANEYDDREEVLAVHPADNALPIISRRRRGLAPDHKFTKALTRAIESELVPLVERMEEEERSGEGPRESSETRRALDRLGREVAKALQESLRELEEDEPPGMLEGALAPLVIIPPVANLVIGETRTLSIVCDSAGIAEDEDVYLTLEPEGAFILSEGNLSPLEPHRRREDALVARVRIRAVEAQEAILTASINGRSNVALLKGIPERPPPPLEPKPESLEFDRPQYRVALGKRKAIDLRAPGSLVNGTDRKVRVISTSDGVVVRGGGLTTLTLDEVLGFYVGTVRIEGRALGTASVEARLDKQTASCKVRVADRDDGLPDLKIEFSHEEATTFRAYFDPPEPGPDGSQTLWVMVKHPSLRPLVGEDLSGEHSTQFRAVLAEVVTEAIARKLITTKYPPSQDIYAEQLYVDHAYWQTKLLPRIRRIVV